MTEKSTLAEALAKAQAAMQNAPLNKTNPHFKSKYADLAAIRDAVTPALSANGLAITQTPTFRDGAFVLVTTLRHTGGETVESIYPLAVDKPQVMGSALTYARRYSLAAMCGIAAEEDDDANAAQDAGAKPQQPKPTPVPTNAQEVKEKTVAWVDSRIADFKSANSHEDLDALLEKHKDGISRLHKKDEREYERLIAVETSERDRIYQRNAA
jgi:hypothetical protein